MPKSKYFADEFGDVDGGRRDEHDVDFVVGGVRRVAAAARLRQRLRLRLRHLLLLCRRREREREMASGSTKIDYSILFLMKGKKMILLPDVR